MRLNRRRLPFDHTRKPEICNSENAPGCKFWSLTRAPQDGGVLRRPGRIETPPAAAKSGEPVKWVPDSPCAQTGYLPKPRTPGKVAAFTKFGVRVPAIAAQKNARPAAMEDGRRARRLAVGIG